METTKPAAVITATIARDKPTVCLSGANVAGRKMAAARQPHAARIACFLGAGIEP